MWKEKRFKSAVLAAIDPTISIIASAAMVVLPLLYGVEGFFLGVSLLAVIAMTSILFDIIATMLILRVAAYKH